MLKTRGFAKESMHRSALSFLVSEAQIDRQSHFPVLEPIVKEVVDASTRVGFAGMRKAEYRYLQVHKHTITQ